MATKKKGRKMVRRRRVRKKSDLPLTKLDMHYIALKECFIAARKAGFTPEQAFWLITEPSSTGLPDWISSDKKDTIIPKIDPTDDEDDD